MFKKLLPILFLFSFSSFQLAGMSADEAYPAIKEVISAMPIPENVLYHSTVNDIELILSTAADTSINLFELIDCMYRYLAPNNKRLEISGEILRNARISFGYGGYPVEVLLPIDNIVSVQVGACFTQDQNPRCGFTKLEPLNFLESYGMYIKKWNITKQVRKIHLYEPGFGAVYARGFFKPKKWELAPISRISLQSAEP